MAGGGYFFSSRSTKYLYESGSSLSSSSFRLHRSHTATRCFDQSFSHSGHTLLILIRRVEPGSLERRSLEVETPKHNALALRAPDRVVPGSHAPELRDNNTTRETFVEIGRHSYSFQIVPVKSTSFSSANVTQPGTLSSPEIFLYQPLPLSSVEAIINQRDPPEGKLPSSVTRTWCQ